MDNLESEVSLDGIAIIGLEGRFPGASSVSDFWHNLCAGVESIAFFSPQELAAAGIDPALTGKPNYVPAAGILTGIDQFDAAFFGFTQREAELLDPQQRLFLECAWQALEDAGYDPAGYPGLIGLYAGASAGSYIFNIWSNAELMDAVGRYQVMLSNDRDFLPTRVSYKLNLQGPSVNVQTACSTSLVAVHLACQSLMSYQCDLALAGGVSVQVPHHQGYIHQEGGITSPDGHCRAFDHKAQGFVSGSGVGVVVLKRLADAIEERDHIYAVIKGTAINNDGSAKIGYTAPSMDGQAAVIAMAQAAANVEPESITYIEAHGTGTALGDPIELAALTQVFQESTARRGFCAIGSVKSNVGHLDAAAGVTGLIKAALAVKHGLIPPTLHIEQPNPKIDWDQSPFYVNSKLNHWRPDGPRRAGVSSFGIGGTNAHVIVEQAPEQPATASSYPYQLLAVSARSTAALDAMSAHLVDYLARHPETPIADVAYTLHVGRRAFAHRRFVVCQDGAEGRTLLEDPTAKRVFTAVTEHHDRPVVFMFPGQGAQYARMGQDAYEHEPIFQEAVDRCAAVLRPLLGLDLRAVLYPPEADLAWAEQQLSRTEITQPALFVIEYALAQLWMHWGVQPQALIGHSIGEYVAACLAGVMALDDALRLVTIRSRLMQQIPAGSMLAVPLTEAQILPRLGDSLALAAINGPARCVVSGPTPAIDALEQQLAAEGIEARRLHTSHAFHSAMLDPIVDPFVAEVARLSLRPPTIPYLSNLTGDWITTAQATDPHYWGQHLRHCVRFADGLARLSEDPSWLLLEVGPGKTLTSLSRFHVPAAAEQIALSSLRHPQEQQSDLLTLLTTLGQLWQAGVAIDWSGVYADRPARRVSLPTYPFERQRYWIEARRSQADHSPAPQIAAQLPPVTSGAPSEQLNLSSHRQDLDMPQDVTTPSSPRYDHLLSKLASMLSRLTGVAPAKISGQASFFEIGLDSLLLIQYNHAIQDEFGVKISIIQLFEEITNLANLAAYLDQTLPPGVAAPPAPPQPALVSAPVETPAASAAPGAPPIAPPGAPRSFSIPPAPAGVPVAPQSLVAASGIEQLMAQQLQVMAQLMAQQLQVLQTSAVPGVSAPASVTPASAPAGSGSAASYPVPESSAPSQGSESLASVPYIPYKPLELGPKGGLTPQQKSYLDDFIARYTARTAESKRQIDQYRPVFADGRNTAIFRLQWKEMVYPIIGARSLGSRIWDVDGNEYLDITMGFGVHLFGHSPDFIVQALNDQLERGMHLGPQSDLAGAVSTLFAQMTGMERVNFCNSGTEAVMGALRIARAITRRPKIVYFSGAYHGWSDTTMARPLMRDDQLTTVPMAPGVTAHAVEDTLVLDYDDPRSLAIIRSRAHEIAAVIVEPVQSRRPELQPRAFLHELRKLTEELDIALIFDEMITGFRAHPGGAQAQFGIRADIATYGKVIGGGMPIGIIAGKARYMDAFDGGAWRYGDNSYPQSEKTLFAAAFFKHPLTMAVTLAVLQHLQAQGPELQAQLNQRTARLAERLNQYFADEQVPIRVVHFSSLFRFNVPHNDKYMELFFYHLTTHGIYNWEGGNCFLSTAHTDADIEYLIQAVQHSVDDLRRGGFLPPAPHRSSTNGNTSSHNGSRVTLPATGRSASPPSAETRSLSSPTAAVSTRGGSGPDQTAQRGVEFSLYYFGNAETHLGHDRYQLLFEGAKFADQHGFRAVWFPERHFHSFGGFSPNPAVIAAALARETKRIHLRAGSVVLPLHHPIRVAEEWSIVDNLSHGRIGVSFASGWHPDDFVFAPDNYEQRRAILDQHLTIVQKLWSGATIEVRGGNGNLVQTAVYPPPIQRHLPMWLSSAHESTFVKAGELGMNVLTNLQDQTVEDLARKIASYRAARVRSGYPAETGHVTVLLHTLVGPDREQTRRVARQPFYTYLKSSMGLVGKIGKSQGKQIDLDRLSADELEYLLADAYERYIQTSALIGDPQSCAAIVDRLIACGVDEIACMIDFGVDTPAVLDHLTHLDTLRQRYQSAEQPSRAYSREQQATSLAPVAPLRLPLTQAQQRLWLLAQLGDDEARLYNESAVHELRGALNMTALERAVQTIVDRHESLRTIFSPDGAYQEVLPSLTVYVPLLDFSELAPEHQALAVADVMHQEREQAFDLAAGPLLRVTAVKRGVDDYLLLFTVHHIIIDGISFGILFRELHEIYQATLQGRAYQLPEPLQFRDYIAWLTEQQQGRGIEEAERYWLQQFTGSVPVLELPLDRPRPATQTYTGTQYHTLIDAALFGRLRAVATHSGTTIFATLLAGFNILLHRLSGQDDLVVGFPAAGQTLMGDQTLTGYCVNLLPLRSTIHDRQSFREYADSVKRTLLQAFMHQNYSFGTLLSKLKLPRDPSRAPLVNVTLTLERQDTNMQLFGMAAREVVHLRSLSRFDLSLRMVEIGESLRLECEYNTALFDASTIERWMSHFQTLLEAIAANPDQRLFELPLLSAAERQALLVARNATATDYPRAATFPQLFAAQVARTPQAIAVQLGSSTLTYHDLAARANQLAQHLQHLGVGPDTRVALCLERSLELVVALLAIWQAGGAFVPLDPAFPTERMAYILDDAQVAVVLTQAALRPSLPTTNLPVLALDTAAEVLASYPTTPPPSQLTADHLAYLIYTSGSTGRPKGVLIPQRGLINYLVWCVAAYGAASGRGAPVHASIAADAIFPSLFAPLLVGTTVVLLPQAQPLEALAEAMTSTGHFSLIKITPSQLEVLQHQLPATDGSTWVETLVIGAEEVRGEILPFWRAHAPATRLLNEYGPTETVVGCSIYAIPPELPPQGSVPIGLPIANTQFYVLDRQMQPVPIGVAGELYIGGDGVAWGYYQRPELTAEQFVPDPFSPTPGARLYKTGDVVKLLADAAANIVFLGRNDDQVKIRGYRVELGEVEGVLRQHPAVGQVVVLAREDQPGDRRLVAYVVTNKEQTKNQEPSTKHQADASTSGSQFSVLGSGELRQFLQQRLPEYMVPSAFVVLDALPILPHGKVDRKALPAPDQTRPELDNSFVAPRTPVEERLVAIWAELLRLEQVGIHDDFFALGGHSLLAMQAISRIRDTLRAELSIRAFMEQPSVARLAAMIDGQESKPVQAIRRVTASPEEQLLAELDQMGDQDLDALLSAMLEASSDHQQSQ